METFNPDPKPGRIVLPLVLIGMIATTYTFINRVATNNDINIVAEETPVETIAEVVVEDTSTTTTSTTLPDNYVAYLEEITAEKIQATELGKEVLEANENWDDKIKKQKMNLELLLQLLNNLYQQFLTQALQMNMQI